MDGYGYGLIILGCVILATGNGWLATSKFASLYKLAGSICLMVGGSMVLGWI